MEVCLIILAKVSGDGNFMQPSSMGCTVKSQDAAGGLEVIASWGIYRKGKQNQLEENKPSANHFY